jgi:hypothetical protein
MKMFRRGFKKFTFYYKDFNGCNYMVQREENASLVIVTFTHPFRVTNICHGMERIHAYV